MPARRSLLRYEAKAAASFHFFTSVGSLAFTCPNAPARPVIIGRMADDVARVPYVIEILDAGIHFAL